MSSENYRFYRLDQVGDLHGAEWFDALNDADAIALVEAMHPGAMCEIWQGQRLVAKLEPYPASEMLAGSRRTLADSRRVLRETANLVMPPMRPDSQGDAR